MQKNERLILNICGVAILFIVSIILARNYSSKDIIQTSSNTSLSSSKIEWGIKREKNHNQPDLGKRNRELIEKYNGIAMGNNENKFVYLTFDLGYEAGYTGKILDILKENNVPAVFFVTAHYVNTAEELVRRMINEGHIVGNHTKNHFSMPNLTEDQIKNELNDLNLMVYQKFGYEMKYMRPPKGEYSERSLNIVNKLGYIPVMWSFAYADWDEKKQPTCEEGINKIIENVHNGEIMLLHATSKTNMEILEIVINKVKEMGYEFKTLDEFVK